MESRKVINKINKDEVLNHVGDLTIEGDIEENAEINVSDGSLIVLGNIKEGARVNLKVSEELRASSVICTSADSSLNVASIGGVSCNIMMDSGSQKIMIGNVNINGRIFTDDQVTKMANGKYKITPASASPFGNSLSVMFGMVSINGVVQQPKSVAGLATATIDGKKYQGKEIIVDGRNVTVDGSKPSDTESSKKPKETAKFIVHGNVGNVVKINSDVDIEVKGTIGSFCQVQSDSAGVYTKDIGEETIISVDKTISVATVGKNCVLKSKHGKLNASTLKNNVKVNVNNSINIDGDISNGCQLESTYSDLKAKNVGDTVIIKVHKDISVENIGSNSRITSEYNGLEANDVGSNVSIYVNKEVDLNSIGDGCTVESEYQSVSVKGRVGNYVTIKASKDIEVGSLGSNNNLTSAYQGIRIEGASGDSTNLHANKDIKVGSLGSNNHLTSEYQGIRIEGASGEGTNLKANKDIHAKDIGNNSALISEYQGVRVKNLGLNVSINANKDIVIDGYCPLETVLNSSYGKVKKSNHPAPVRKEPPAPSMVEKHKIDAEALLASQKYENDLQQAIVLSQVEMMKKQGLFAAPPAVEPIAPVQKPKTVEIPEAYICIITQDIMTKPVICILDGRTYEDSAIREWLKQKKTSPHHRKEMKPGQSIDDVLITNYNLAEAIEQFRKDNPQLFEKNVKKM